MVLVNSNKVVVVGMLLWEKEKDLSLGVVEGGADVAVAVGIGVAVGELVVVVKFGLKVEKVVVRCVATALEVAVEKGIGFGKT